MIFEWFRWCLLMADIIAGTTLVLAGVPRISVPVALGGALIVFPVAITVGEVWRPGRPQ